MAGLPLSRRRFLQSSATVGLLGAIQSTVHAAAALEPIQTAEYGNPLVEFSYGSVQLAPGPHQAQFLQTHEVLMGLNEDSLLRPYRLAAGRPAPGFDLGGWYSATPEIVKTGPTGPETFGQWVSALSRHHAVTGEKASQEKVKRLIAGYAQTVEPSGKAFQFSGNTEYFYNMLVGGLEDAYKFAGVQDAPVLISKTTAAFRPRLAGRAIDQLGPEGSQAHESYIVPENQFIAWQWTGDADRLAMGKSYLAEDFLVGPLAAGENVLPGRHVNSTTLALVSTAKAYLVLGDEKYLKAAMNGYRFMEQQSYATGAWGAGELFVPAKLTEEQIAGIKKNDPNYQISGYNSLGDAVLKLKTHFETPCGSYAHSKLSRYLLRVTKDPHYGDGMERVMYNCALGALPLNNFGKSFYQSNYSKYATKQYFDGYGNIMEDEWPCCSGSLPQLAADYHISAYFQDEKGVFVNLYIPSTLKWRQGDADVALTQVGDYPLADGMTFTIDASKPSRFALRFRIPAWAVDPTIHVNGKVQAVRPGSFATITRSWASGDRIELVLPKKLELKAVDQMHPDLVALVNGPIVLFAIGYDLPKLSRDTLLAAKQTAPASPEWKSGDIRFLPWWIIKDEVYTTYHDVA